MPLSDEDEVCAPAFHLRSWSVVDGDTLVAALAWLYLQKPRHAQRVIEALDPETAHLPGREVDSAIRNLSYRTADIEAALASPDEDVRKAAETKRQKRIELRDGLLFQHVSWVAARLRFPKAHLTAPHPRPADKGFDGVLIEFNDAGDGLERLVISEDKASTDPRPLIRTQIWPELETIVAGDRDGEVMHSITALLDRTVGVEHEHILEGVAWSRIRQFRILVTSPETEVKEGSYKHLFEGYDERAPDPIEGRMAEVMPLPDVRAFLDELAEDVKAALENLANV